MRIVTGVVWNKGQGEPVTLQSLRQVDRIARACRAVFRLNGFERIDLRIQEGGQKSEGEEGRADVSPAIFVDFAREEG